MAEPTVSGNLKVANKGVFFLLMVALPFDNALFHFALFLLLITFLLTVYEKGRKSFVTSVQSIRRVHAAFLGILLIMGLSNLINSQGIEAWSSMLKFAVRYWFLLAMVHYLLDEKILSLRFLFVTAIAAIAFQILPFLPLIWSGDIFGTRFYGFTSNPNIMGLYAGLGIMIGVYIATDKNGGMPILRHLISLVVVLIAGAALLASGSRASWVGLIGGLACYMVFVFRRNAKTIMPLLASLFIAAAYIFTQFSLPKQRLELLLKGYPALRDQVWENSYHLFADKPFFGYGLDTRAALSQNHQIYSEHNIFLSVLLALGAFGLLAYCRLLFTICWPALKNRDAVGLSAMTFLMGVGMFGFDFYADQHFMVNFILISSVCLCHSSKPTHVEK